MMNNQRQHNSNGTTEMLCINVAGINDQEEQKRSKGGSQQREENLGKGILGAIETSSAATTTTRLSTL